jgi:hypothetical protein
MVKSNNNDDAAKPEQQKQEEDEDDWTVGEETLWVNPATFNQQQK